MRRSLIHYWRVHLGLLLGAAVAATALTGALLVGDSVRGSLRDLTLNRLGAIDHALVAERYFRQQLASEIEGFERVSAAVLLRGSVENAQSGSRASKVNVHGVDDVFFLVIHRALGAQLPADPAFCGASGGRYHF